MDFRRRFSAFVDSGRDPSTTIVEALEFTRDFLPQSSLEERAKIKVAIVVEELVSNTLRHGGAECDLSLWLSFDDKGGSLAIEMEDDAPPFDPTRTPEFSGPDPRTGGGIGLAIIRAWGEDITYTRHENRNVVRLTIR